MAMCETEYSVRKAKHRVYHMGLVTRVGAEKSLSGVTPDHFRAHYSVPPEPVVKGEEAPPVTYEVKMYHNSIYLAGRTRKIDFYHSIFKGQLLIYPHQALGYVLRTNEGFPAKYSNSIYF